MAVSCREVEEAVNQFYGNPMGKTEVHTWLTQAQHSTHAWNFAFLLLDPSKVFTLMCTGWIIGEELG